MSVMATTRVVHAVAEWNLGSGVDLNFGVHRGHHVFEAEKYGSPQDAWHADLAWALQEIIDLGPLKPRSVFTEAPDDVVELLPARVLTPAISAFGSQPSASAVGDHVDPLLARRARMRTITPWPMPRLDPLIEVAQIMVDHPHLILRFRLGSAAPVEMDMLGDALNETWTGSDGDLHLYLGRPIRLRVLLGSRRGPVPARFKALVRRWATNLSVAPLFGDEALRAWAGGPSALEGHVVPEGAAISLVRLPVAGESPFPGMETRHAQSVAHPLDPVPRKPESPLRVGSAQTVTGRKVDAVLDIRDLIRHAFVEGQSGAGKSTLIATLVRELTASGFGCTLLDPHGTTIDSILAELPERSDRTYVIRHEDTDAPIPLDVITGDAEQVERVVDIFAEMVQQMYDPERSGIVGPRWRSWFSLIARGAFFALGEEASLVSITEIGSDVERVRRLADALQSTQPRLAKSLLDEIVNDRSVDAAALLSWCISKLRPLVSTGQMRAILGTGHDAVDVREFIDSGRTLLVDLASPVLGEPASRILGALWLLKHRLAMATRVQPPRPHIIIVDEAHLFQYGALPSLLAEGRKFGLGVVVATQFLGQLEDGLASSLEANAGSFISLRTGLQYAQRSSVRLGGWPASELVRLPNLTAAASLSREGTMTEPFTLHIDHHERMEKTKARGLAAAERAADVAARSRAELWAPYSHL